jgi:methyl-accepting chemotaxis protein
MEAIREQAEAVAENVVSLSERTQAIGEIITTVNDIAEQSHLLALNAAIEAAAAGEHGRSFSVIAGEVKNLADQSREATIQVRTILGDIQKGINSSVMLTEEAVKRVESGKQQADVADRTIREMTESIQVSVQAFQQIVAGSNQQQIGFTQVVQAVRDIGQASQQSAASTRNLEKAAVNMTALAQQLQKAVERYRL